jgi:hypothetical protein
MGMTDNFYIGHHTGGVESTARHGQYHESISQLQKTLGYN